MNFLKQTWEQVIAIWQKLERKQKVAFILSLGTFVVALCFFISWATRPEYSLLLRNKNQFSHGGDSQGRTDGI